MLFAARLALLGTAVFVCVDCGVDWGLILLADAAWKAMSDSSSRAGNEEKALGLDMLLAR